MTKIDREARWARMRDYLARGGTLPAAMRLAKAEGFSGPTAAWITTMGQILGASARPPEPPEVKEFDRAVADAVSESFDQMQRFEDSANRATRGRAHPGSGRRGRRRTRC